jgi:hypothetical protein
MTCPGHRRPNGKLLGICVTCDLQDDASQMAPAARMADVPCWECPSRRYTPPVDRLGTHRFASQAASAANSAAIDSSARTSSDRTAAADQS